MAKTSATSNEYSVKISESSRELNAYERVKFKDYSDAVKLDEAAENGVQITPDFYVILSIHNPKSDNPDYFNYMIVDKDGTKYVTGSPTFWTSFKSIFDEMNEENLEYTIKAYKVDSKNYKGKKFITCSLV